LYKMPCIVAMDAEYGSVWENCGAHRYIFLPIAPPARNAGGGGGQ
jgi:hypothetical protein